MKTLTTTTIILLFAVTAYAAESSLQDLIQARQTAYAEVEKIKKENDDNVAAFNKLQAVAEFNIKMKLLQERWQKAQGKINELNERIAEKVSKEKGK